MRERKPGSRIGRPNIVKRSVLFRFISSDAVQVTTLTGLSVELLQAHSKAYVK